MVSKEGKEVDLGFPGEGRGKGCGGEEGKKIWGKNRGRRGAWCQRLAGREAGEVVPFGSRKAEPRRASGRLAAGLLEALKTLQGPSNRLSRSIRTYDWVIQLRARTIRACGGMSRTTSR